MIRDKKTINKVLILLLLLILIVLFAEFLLPDKFQSDGTESKIAKYRVYWIIVGVLHVLLTLAALCIGIVFELRKTGYKTKSLVDILVMLCSAILWLCIVLRPVIAFLNRYSIGTVLRGL